MKSGNRKSTQSAVPQSQEAASVGEARTKINCSELHCAFNKAGVCQVSEIEFMEGSCLSFMAYTSLPEYKNTFWIAIKDENGKQWRVRQRGFKLVYDGYTLYTTEDVREQSGMDNAFFTEKDTGYSVGNISNLKDEEKMKQLKETVKKCVNVLSLPVMAKGKYLKYLERTHMLDNDELPF